MDYQEIIDMVISELSQKAISDLRTNNPEYNALRKEQVIMSDSVFAYTKTLPEDKQQMLEIYDITKMNAIAVEMRHLYIQGARDCVCLLKKLDVL